MDIHEIDGEDYVRIGSMLIKDDKNFHKTLLDAVKEMTPEDMANELLTLQKEADHWSACNSRNHAEVMSKKTSVGGVTIDM